MDHDPAGLGVVQAASRLGISVDAVRKRIRRGTLRAYKVDGAWRVVLDVTSPIDQAPDPDDGQVGPGPAVQDASGSLIDQLRSEVAFLRQLTEHQAGVIAQQAAAIAPPTRAPELPAAGQAPTPDRPVPATRADSDEARTDRESTATRTGRRPWWGWWR